MSETIAAATPIGVAATELWIAFSTEELVVLGRVLTSSSASSVQRRWR